MNYKNYKILRLVGCSIDIQTVKLISDISFGEIQFSCCPKTKHILSINPYSDKIFRHQHNQRNVLVFDKFFNYYHCTYSLYDNHILRQVDITRTDLMTKIKNEQFELLSYLKSAISCSYLHVASGILKEKTLLNNDITKIILNEYVNQWCHTICVCFNKDRQCNYSNDGLATYNSLFESNEIDIDCSRCMYGRTYGRTWN